MATFLLHHRHEARECPVAFAAWKGYASPLRNRATDASCPHGRHEIWWHVEAEDEADALANLPEWVAHRTSAAQISRVRIP